MFARWAVEAARVYRSRTPLIWMIFFSLCCCHLVSRVASQTVTSLVPFFFFLFFLQFIYTNICCGCGWHVQDINESFDLRNGSRMFCYYYYMTGLCGTADTMPMVVGCLNIIQYIKSVNTVVEFIHNSQPMSITISRVPNAEAVVRHPLFSADLIFCRTLSIWVLFHFGDRKNRVSQVIHVCWLKWSPAIAPQVKWTSRCKRRVKLKWLRKHLKRPPIEVRRINGFMCSKSKKTYR